jgi:hypothetical protein
MAEEPLLRQLYHAFERARLLEKVSGPGNDLQLGLATQPAKRRAIERENVGIGAAHDQQGRRPDIDQRGVGEIGAAAPRDDCSNFASLPRGRDQSSGGARARAEVIDGERVNGLELSRPFSCGRKPLRQQRNVEHIGSIGGLGLGQEIEE